MEARRSGVGTQRAFEVAIINAHARETTTMSQTSRAVQPVAEELPQEITDLAAALRVLSPEARLSIEPIFQQVVESTRRRRRILNLVQEALSQLRLDMKYLMFDLEATRRERDESRRKLEEGNAGEGEV